MLLANQKVQECPALAEKSLQKWSLKEIGCIALLCRGAADMPQRQCYIRSESGSRAASHEMRMEGRSLFQANTIQSS
jgi:hypothetical protein